MKASHWDSPDMVIIFLSSLIVALIALAVFGVIDLDDVEQRSPLAPAVYETLPPAVP